MSRENVEIVRRGYEAFRQGGIEAAAALLDPDVEWIPPKDSPHAATYRGTHAVKTEVREFTGPFEDYEWEPREFIDAGDRVVVIGYHHGRGRQSGVEVGQEETHVWTVREGRIVRIEMFHDRREALQAAGLSEPAVSQANVEDLEAVRKHYDGFNRGDLDAVMEPLADDVVFELEADTGPFAARYQGQNEVRNFFKEMWEVVEDLRAEPLELIEAAGAIVVPVRLSGRFKHTGITGGLPEDTTHVHNVRGGKILRLHVYRNKAAALEALGARP